MYRLRSRARQTRASRGTAKAISWKSAFTASWIPQESPYATVTQRPECPPRSCWVVRPTMTAPSANSAAWANSRASADGQIQYSGASSATIGEKWSPRIR